MPSMLSPHSHKYVCVCLRYVFGKNQCLPILKKFKMGWGGGGVNFCYLSRDTFNGVQVKGNKHRYPMILGDGGGGHRDYCFS